MLDPSRPTEASCAALLQFEDGAAASLVYSGYDHFDSDEWHFGISERGAPKQIAHGAARRSLAKAQDETRARTETFAYGAASADLPPHQPHFGVTIVTCAEGDMRASADGVTIYDRDGMRQIPIPRGGSMPGRREVLDDMRDGDPVRPAAGAQRPLGQGHGGGRAGDPAIGAGGPRGRAGASGGGAGRIVRPVRRRREIASSRR